MVKILVLMTLLGVSPVFTLLEKFYQVENNCYIDCRDKFGESLTLNEACRTGCGYKVVGSDCNDHCAKFSADEAAQDSCKFGCSSMTAEDIINTKDTPAIAVDPVPKETEKEEKNSQDKTETEAKTNSEFELPRSLIIIRLRQRPILMPPPESMVDLDPRKMFREMIERFHQRVELIQKQLETANSEQNNPVSFLKSIRYDLPVASEEDSSEEDPKESNKVEIDSKFNAKKPCKWRNLLEETQGRLQAFTNQRSNPYLFPLIGVIVLTTVVILYMLMALCKSARKKYTTIESKGVYLQFCDHEVFTKEKIQPEYDVFEPAEPLPISVKLSKI